jgi:hypothetical protein
MRPNFCSWPFSKFLKFQMFNIVEFNDNTIEIVRKEWYITPEIVAFPKASLHRSCVTKKTIDSKMASWMRFDVKTLRKNIGKFNFKSIHFIYIGSTIIMFIFSWF